MEAEQRCLRTRAKKSISEKCSFMFVLPFTYLNMFVYFMHIFD